MKRSYSKIAFGCGIAIIIAFYIALSFLDDGSLAGMLALIVIGILSFVAVFTALLSFCQRRKNKEEKLWQAIIGLIIGLGSLISLAMLLYVVWLFSHATFS